MLERAISNIILVRKEKSLLFRTNFICQESRDRRGLWSLQGWVGFGAYYKNCVSQGWLIIAKSRIFGRKFLEITELQDVIL